MSTTASNSTSRIRQFSIRKIKSFQGSNTLFQLYVEIHLKSKTKYHNTPHKVLQYKTKPKLKHSLNFPLTQTNSPPIAKSQKRLNHLESKYPRSIPTYKNIFHQTHKANHPKQKDFQALK